MCSKCYTLQGFRMLFCLHDLLFSGRKCKDALLAVNFSLVLLSQHPLSEEHSDRNIFVTEMVNSCFYGSTLPQLNEPACCWRTCLSHQRLTCRQAGGRIWDRNVTEGQGCLCLFQADPDVSVTFMGCREYHKSFER